MRRKALFTIGVIMLLLVITNPGLQEFKSYLHQNTDNNPAGREANFFIFSIYSDIGDYPDAPRNTHQIKFRYLGLLGNFFPIGSGNVY